MKLHHSISSKNRSGGFTLIELLVVITIIAILATITIVAGGPAIIRAKKLDATAVCKDLVKSLTAYQLDYSRLPGVGTFKMVAQTSATDPSGNTVASADVMTDSSLMTVLMGNETTTPKINTRNEKYHNPKFTGTAGVVGTAPTGGLDNNNQLGDPFGNFYHVVMDTNGSGSICNPDNGGTSKFAAAATLTLNIPAAAWSAGPKNNAGGTDRAIAPGTETAGLKTTSNNDSNCVTWR